MGTVHRDIVADWLAAEAAGRQDEADLAFAGVAEALPGLAPSPQFVSSVMQRVATERVAGPSAVWASWWLRAMVAASLVMLGAVSGTVTWKSVLFASLTTVQTVAWGLNQLAAGGRAWLGAALAAWDGVAHVGAALGRVLVAPGPAAVILVNLAVASCALAALQRLLIRQES